MKKLLVATVLLFAAVSALITVTNRYPHAEAAGESGDVSSKLTQILDNQKSIMQTLDSIKQELNIIKIRITQSQ